MESWNQEPNDEKPPLGPTDVKGGNTGESIQPSPMATIEDEDERLLARIGYRQVRGLPIIRRAV